MSTTLTELRARVLAKVKRGNSSFGQPELDYAIQSALQELQLDDYFNSVVGSTFTCTANNHEVSVSGVTVTGFSDFAIRPENVYRLELIPSSGFNQVIPIVDYASLGHWQGDRPEGRLVPDEYAFSVSGDITPGQPRAAAWFTPLLLHLYPTPDAIYSFRFLLKMPVTTIVPGGPSVTLEVPDHILIPAVEGMAYHLDPTHPMAETWLKRFEMHKRKVEGNTGITAEVPMKDRLAYIDHTDSWE